MFFIVLTIFLLFFLSIILLSIYGTVTDYKSSGGDISQIIPIFIVLPIMFLLIFGFMYFIGNFTFKDSKQRGMDPWLWTSVAVFVPNLIGLIVYLIIRNSSTSKICLNCAKPIDEHFINCPFCGNKLKDNCPSCGSVIELEWNICANCGIKLK